MSRFFVILVSAWSLAACDTARPPKLAPEPIVVYATAVDESKLNERFKVFTEESGIPVTVKYGDSEANTNLVISNQGSPHADVLLTTNVADIWRAADEGALLPIQSERLLSVAAMFKDPDRLWVADEVRLAAVISNRGSAGPEVDSFSDLAKQGLQGRLCLLSSGHSLSRSLIAMLIEELGVRPAERLVRGWVQNLALPPFDSEQQLVAAIQSGACAYGILSDAATAEEMIVLVPQPAYFDIDGLGIVRHSRYPQSAQRLVDWMLSKQRFDSAVVKPRNIGAAGWRDNDAILLAERAGYH